MGLITQGTLSLLSLKLNHHNTYKHSLGGTSAQSPAKSLSLEAFLQQPETKPASEYGEGRIVQKPFSSSKQSRLKKSLLKKIDAALFSGKVAEAFPELRCSFGGRSLVPDIVVLRRENIPTDPSGEIANSVLTAPDWMIETVSSASSYRRATKNILHGLEYGCQMGWLIDLEERTVVVSPRNEQPRSLNLGDDILPVPDWAAVLKLSAGELFSWLVEPPILKFAGVFEGDPEFAEIVAAMRAERELEDENPAYTVNW